MNLSRKSGRRRSLRWGLSGYAILRGRGGRILVLQRTRKARGFPGEWDIPGGKLDLSERIEEGIPREVREETGLCVRLARLAGASEARVAGRRIVLLFFEARGRGRQVVLSREHDAFAWVTADELGRLPLARHLLGFLRDYAKKLGRPDGIG